MTLFRIWALLPNGDKGLGWSCVARDLTPEQAAVYEATFVFKIRVEPEEDLL
jgi:hypothetical protein